MAKGKVNQKGFTLMEVLVSIAIVGIIFLPLLSVFSDSAKINNITAKNMQRSTTAAQSVMEEFRAYSTIEEIVNLYEDTANNGGKMMRTDSTFRNEYKSSVKAADDTFNNTKYYFLKKGIESDGKNYNARITVDTSKYQTLNDVGLPMIESLGAGSTIMACEKDDQIQSVLEDLVNNPNYAGYTKNQLANKLKKIICIEITDTAKVDEHSPELISEGMVRVKIYNKYELDGSSLPIDFEPLYNEEVVLENLKGIYLFYNYEMYSDTENIFQEIQIDINNTRTTLDQYKFSFYGLCQQVYSVGSGSSHTTDINAYLASKNVKPVIDVSTNASGIGIFSNINYTLLNGSSVIDKIGEDIDNIVREEKIQRLAEVTVEIYDNEDTTYGKPVATLTSTRGE